VNVAELQGVSAGERTQNNKGRFVPRLLGSNGVCKCDEQAQLPR
jgi:hypothetical protein